MAKFTLIFYCKRPSKNRSIQNEIDVCVLWLKYLVGASELLVTVFSPDDGVTDFWFLYFRSFISEIREDIPLQADSFVVSTAVIYGLILQQVFPYGIRFILIVERPPIIIATKLPVVVTSSSTMIFVIVFVRLLADGTLKEKNSYNLKKEKKIDDS